MLKVRLICVGKLKEKFYADAFAEYARRLGAYCKFDCVEIPEQRLGDEPSQKEISSALSKEAVEIERNIPKDSYVIAMCVGAKLAEKIAALAVSGRAALCFIVGGSFGLSDGIKARADMRLGMSEMTFPHHLARVMLAEQIYRSFKINEGSRYHK